MPYFMLLSMSVVQQFFFQRIISSFWYKIRVIWIGMNFLLVTGFIFPLRTSLIFGRKLRTFKRFFCCFIGFDLFRLCWKHENKWSIALADGLTGFTTIQLHSGKQVWILEIQLLVNRISLDYQHNTMLAWLFH